MGGKEMVSWCVSCELCELVPCHAMPRYAMLQTSDGVRHSSPV